MHSFSITHVIYIGTSHTAAVVIITVLGLLCMFLVVGIFSWILVKKCSPQPKSMNGYAGESSQEPCPVYEDIGPTVVKSTYSDIRKISESIELNENKAYE